MTSEIWVARLTGGQATIVWPKVEEMLVPAIAGSSGLFTPDEVRERVTASDAGTPDGWSLWIIADRDQLMGAWTTKFQHFPRERLLEVVFAGGSDMESWYEMALGETEKFAAAMGCRRLRCGGRRGWARFGWSPVGHMFERVFA